MTTFRTVVVTLITLVITAQFAPTAAADTQLQVLEAAKEDVAVAAKRQRHRRVAKGGPRWRVTGKGRQLLRLRGDLNGLIKDLEEGRAVDPGEIERALQRAENATR